MVAGDKASPPVQAAEMEGMIKNNTENNIRRNFPILIIIIIIPVNINLHN
jgi:hypothetical protein